MKNKIYHYAIVSLGCVIAAIGINSFYVPHHILSSGLSGIAIIFYYLFKWPIGLQIFIMNIPLFYLAYKHIGKNYVITNIYGTFLFAAAIDMTKFLANMPPIQDALLSAIAGGILAGVGGGLIFRVGGSAGGLDIVCIIINKYYSFNIGHIGFGVNLFIMLASALLFGLDLAVLTLISIFIGAVITNKVIDGFNTKKSIYIISYKSENIAKAIIEEVGRGVTILYGEGAYTGQRKQVVFVVVNLMQVNRIKELAHIADPEAFMIVNDAVEVLGKGFTPLGHKHI